MYFSLILDDGSRMLLEQVGRGLLRARAWSGRGRTRCPTPLMLWQETQLATWKSCLPLPNERPLLELARPTAARSSNFHSLRGRLDLSSSSAIGSGMARPGSLGVGEVVVEVVDDVERPVHPPPVAGIGADIRIDAGLRGRGEAQLLRLARLEQAAGAAGSCSSAGRTAARSASGLGGRRLGQEADLLEGAGPRHDEVVRHQVGVLEEDLHRLAGLDDDPVLVVAHLLEHRADADHPDAQLAELLADRPGLVGSAAGPPGRRRAAGRRGPRATSGRRTGICRAIGDEALEQRPGLFRGPVGGGDLLQGQDRGVAVDVARGRTGPGPGTSGTSWPRTEVRAFIAA